MFAWNGQFSPQFIEALLSEYASSNSFAIDTFAGSGTTLCESARRNLQAYGAEINAQAFHIITDAIVEGIANHKNTFYAYILAALLIIMDIFSNEITAQLIQSKWANLAGIITGLPYTEKAIRAERGDARCLNLNDDSANILITSPPYINVFNYHQKYRRSAEALGYDVLKTARSEIGSNRKNRSNRFITVIQYCIYMAMSLREASRVCKKMRE